MEGFHRGLYRKVTHSVVWKSGGKKYQIESYESVRSRFFLS